MNIEKEIDHRIQLMGYRLGEEDESTRQRIRYDIERAQAERKAWLERPAPTFAMPLRKRK